MAILDTISTVIGLVDKIVDLNPSYSEKVKKKWIHLKEEYNKQRNLELTERDADYILNLKDAIMLYAKDLLEKK